MLRRGNLLRRGEYEFSESESQIRFKLSDEEALLVEDITDILYNEGVLPEASVNLLGRFALAKFLDEFQRMESLALENLRQERFQRRQGRQI